MKFLCSLIWAVGIFAVAATWAQNPDTQAVTHDEASTQHADTEPYCIRIEDVLVIAVWHEPELSGSVTVRPDGKITLPLLNDVRVVGLTPQELAEALTEMLKPFITLPQVTVVVRGIEVTQPSDPRKRRMLPPVHPRFEMQPPPPLWPFVVA